MTNLSANDQSKNSLVIASVDQGEPSRLIANGLTDPPLVWQTLEPCCQIASELPHYYFSPSETVIRKLIRGDGY
jgi:hypothetical protein